MTTPGRLVGSGRVTLYPPTPARAYFRLTFTDSGSRRCQRSASRDPAAALALAQSIDTDLSRQHGEAGHRTLGDLAAEYVATPRRRRRTPQGRLTGQDWQPAQHAQVRQNLLRAVQDVTALPAWSLDRTVIDHMRTACGTDNSVHQMTSVVRTFLRWCEEQGALTAEQVALLPAANAPARAPRFAQPTPRPARARLARRQGQAADYVGEEDCPTRADVLALASALQARVCWGELAVHTAVGTGLRQGEQFQLTPDDLERGDDGMLYVRVDWQWSSLPGRRCDPKHRKRRVVPVSPRTRDGYPLDDALLARAAQARAEQAAGTNPGALLFPAPNGGMWWPSSLITKCIVPAMKAAGWSYVTVTEERTRRGTSTRHAVQITQMHRTWHSLRHRFARDMIDHFHLPEGALMAIGGWENLSVVQARYYRTGAEHVAAAALALREADPHLSAHADRDEPPPIRAAVPFAQQTQCEIVAREFTAAGPRPQDMWDWRGRPVPVELVRDKGGMRTVRTIA